MCGNRRKKATIYKCYHVNSLQAEVKDKRQQIITTNSFNKYLQPNRCKSDLHPNRREGQPLRAGKFTVQFQGGSRCGQRVGRWALHALLVRLAPGAGEAGTAPPARPGPAPPATPLRPPAQQEQPLRPGRGGQGAGASSHSQVHSQGLGWRRPSLPR